VSPQGRPKEYRSAQRAAGPTGGNIVPPSRLWWLAAGFSVWCSALVFLYALQAIGCVFAWPAGTLRLSLVVVFLAHLVVIGWMWRNFAKGAPDPADGPTGGFLHAAIVWTAIAAFVATVFTFGPPLLLATCI
jgi:hypothetical protein